jgi:SAM-dependent methyltransferase
MNKALSLVQDELENITSISFSSPRTKGETRNINMQRTSKSEFKVEFRLQKHNDIKTLTLDECEFESYLNEFKQCFIKTNTSEIQILLNKKKQSKIITKEVKATSKENHNRVKNYLIPDGTPCPFLEEIGVMNNKGIVKNSHYKKFRQINRFLEMLDDLYRNENKDEFHVVDFGCGKSYLTFAINHYFIEIRKVKAKITGVDLKQEVIDHCNQISSKLGYEGLNFVHGFIHDFKIEQNIDLVITLHACDTATDDAIIFSLDHDAQKMMFVPCCQHELNKQLSNNESQPLLKHGIFRDRMTALVTDTMRTQLLEACGYKVQSMEFIDLEHTAKNILLRCIKTDKTKMQNKKSLEAYNNFKAQWEIKPYLEQKLIEKDYL